VYQTVKYANGLETINQRKIVNHRINYAAPHVLLIFTFLFVMMWILLTLIDRLEKKVVEIQFTIIIHVLRIQ
jgi:hypothetical protein